MNGFETRSVCIFSYSNNEASRSFRRRNDPDKKVLGTLDQLISLHIWERWARSQRGDSITDGWSKPDFVLKNFDQINEQLRRFEE
jgi:hypothetical protein